MANFFLINGSLINLECVAWAEMRGREGPASEGFDEATLVLHFSFPKMDGQGKTHTYTLRDDDAIMAWEHILRQDVAVLRPWKGGK